MSSFGSDIYLTYLSAFDMSAYTAAYALEVLPEPAVCSHHNTTIELFLCGVIELRHRIVCTDVLYPYDYPDSDGECCASYDISQF